MERSFLKTVSVLFLLLFITGCGEESSSNGVNGREQIFTDSAPVAVVGPDRTVSAGSQVSLDGSLSYDPDGDPLTFTWTVLSRPSGSASVLSDAGASAPSFTADIAGTYILALVVSAGGDQSEPAFVTITASNQSSGNSAPLAVVGPDRGVLVGSQVTLDGSLSFDSNGDPLTYTWTLFTKPMGSAAVLSGTDTVSPSFIADVAGAYTAALVVDDGSNQSAPAFVTITASYSLSDNQAPVAIAGLDQEVVAGSQVFLTGFLSYDPEGGSILYAWTFLGMPNGSTAVLSNPAWSAPWFTADADGTYVISLVVNDGLNDSAPALVTITSTNQPPEANAGADGSVPTHASVTLDGSASTDADGHTLTYIWSFLSRPAGSSAILSNPTSVAPSFTADVDGDYVLGLVVNDGLADSAPDTITLAASNLPPSANAGPDQYAFLGAGVSLDGGASSDANGDAITYSWTITMKPAGSIATLSDPASPTPAFTVDIGGEYQVTLVVNDGNVDSSDMVRVVAHTFDCTDDDVALMGASGYLNTGPSRDFVPLCNGWVLYGDRALNQIVLLNAATGAIDRSYQLSSMPGDLEYDDANGLLYAAQSSSTLLAQIDVVGGGKSDIPLGGATRGMALGNEGRLFVSYEPSSSYSWEVALVNGTTMAVENTWTMSLGFNPEVLGYDKFGDQLIMGEKGYSPSSLRRYAFNPVSGTLSFMQELRDAGSNGRDLAVSPDGNHVAFPNGAGNGAGYTIFDFNSDDLTSIYGEWNTGNYPSAAAFSPDGNYLVATDSYSLKVFDVATHVLLADYPLDFVGCDYDRVQKVGFSRGGKVVFLNTECGFYEDSGRIFWAVFQP